MKVVKFLLGSALGAILILVAIGFFLPSHWRVERHVVIKATPDRIYPYIANLKNGWPQFSAIDQEERDMSYEYQGPEVGDGAIRILHSKSGGNRVQKITKADPNNGIDYEISMQGGGFVMYGSINMRPDTDGTKVIWVNAGDMGANPMYKIMGYLMDSLMGKALQKSLDNLKEKVEGTSTKTNISSSAE
ncbi:SRPBCC family protein [Bdellovibrio sp. NC01]|uniref:SRPBCC family protein n=1 Tax=Bdellovibrio sp. NC01 TaxID=2220073 RepID=UPI00143DA633|nr:SRPBCC family protein [Bdellovibrio sp. NC01]